MNLAITFTTAWLQCLTTVPIDSIKSIQETPIAPIGGVIMVQLVSEELGDSWPQTMEVSFDSGDKVTGYLGWVELNNNRSAWASNPSIIRPILPTDDTRRIHPLDLNTGPVLLIKLPENASGSLTFGGTTIDPIWVSLPKEMPNVNISPIDYNKTLSINGEFELPEWNPLEYWRWSLVASRSGVCSPEPPADNLVVQLAALQSEQLWRIGFDRLARSSRGVAAACRDLLTNTAFDGSVNFACWVTSQDAIKKLLEIVTDQNISSRQLSARALNWVQEQQPFIAWLENVYAQRITLAFANPTLEPSLATVIWNQDDVFPSVIELPATKTVREKIDRAIQLDLSDFGAQSPDVKLQWLTLQLGNQQYSLPIVPNEVVVHPPSAVLPVLHPTWTLENIHKKSPRRVSPDKQTLVELRKMFGVWELYVRCKGNNIESDFPELLEQPKQLIGHEAISIVHQKTNSFVSISPDGVVRGVNIPSDLEVFNSKIDDGWSVRVELPTSWVDNEQLTISLIRTHSDSQEVETSPLPCLPWNLQPAPIVFDLSQWEKVKQIPTTYK
jgi:hypothetical protein